MDEFNSLSRVKEINICHEYIKIEYEFTAWTCYYSDSPSSTLSVNMVWLTGIRLCPLINPSSPVWIKKRTFLFYNSQTALIGTGKTSSLFFCFSSWKIKCIPSVRWKRFPNQLLNSVWLVYCFVAFVIANSKTHLFSPWKRLGRTLFWWYLRALKTRNLANSLHSDNKTPHLITCIPRETTHLTSSQFPIWRATAHAGAPRAAQR